MWQLFQTELVNEGTEAKPFLREYWFGYWEYWRGGKLIRKRVKLDWPVWWIG